jgi:hydrogenase maturation protein HypF
LEDRRLIGLSFDGAGYGTDGRIWGGEVLLASFRDFARFARLEYLPLPGGDRAKYAPWRIAAGYAHALGIDVEDLPFLQNVDKRARQDVYTQIKRQAGSPLTSSMGYLFDAVASLIGVRNEITYEAQAATEMEVLSRPFISAAGTYPYVVDNTDDGKIIRVYDLLHSIAADVRAKTSVGRIGASFHKTMADLSIDVCKQARESSGLQEVALSGGVWQNQILLDLVRDGLQQNGFIVYFHKQVPTNDGGLSLGQAVIAHHLRATESEPAGAHDLNSL